MSDTATETEAPSPYTKVVEKEGTTYTLETFEKGTKFEGFYFYSKEYKDLEAARKQILAIKPDADADGILIGMINTALAAKMRQKVTAGVLPSDEDALKKMLARGENLCLDLETAEKFVPGEREPYSESGINKRIKQLIDLKKEAKELLNTDLADEDKDKVLADIGRFNEEGKFLLKKLEELRNKTQSQFDE